MTFMLGAIADDFTGATDLASFLRKRGLRVLQLIDVPESPAADFVGRYDALVVALKSRTVEPQDAVNVSLKALAWLQAASCERYYFKYCSTFDSTPRGNIGPVMDALLDQLGEAITVVCPALPANGRTVYKATLFVGDVRLDESGMKDHPLTPMRDANLVRLLEPQVAGRIGRLDHSVVRAGAAAVEAELQRLLATEIRYVIADAVNDDDLISVGQGAARLRLLTGGSGLALGITFSNVEPSLRPTPTGFGDRAAIISGSSSMMTNAQVAEGKKHFPFFHVRATEIAAGQDVAAQALAWADNHPDAPTLMFFATDTPDAVRKVQAQLGVEAAGAMIEGTLARIAAGVRDRGIGTIVVAGGETSGAVVRALGVRALEIGDDLAAGVPWTFAVGVPKPLRLALKSGNFGSQDFFFKARGLA